MNTRSVAVHEHIFARAHSRDVCVEGNVLWREIYVR